MKAMLINRVGDIGLLLAIAFDARSTFLNMDIANLIIIFA